MESLRGNCTIVQACRLLGTRRQTHETLQAERIAEGHQSRRVRRLVHGGRRSRRLGRVGDAEGPTIDDGQPAQPDRAIVQPELAPILGHVPSPDVQQGELGHAPASRYVWRREKTPSGSKVRNTSSPHSPPQEPLREKVPGTCSPAATPGTLLPPGMGRAPQARCPGDRHSDTRRAGSPRGPPHAWRIGTRRAVEEPVGAGRPADRVQAPRPGGGTLRSCGNQYRAIAPWCRRFSTSPLANAM